MSEQGRESEKDRKERERERESFGKKQEAPGARCWCKGAVESRG